MYDEYDFTLEDALDAVDEYLGEAAAVDAAKKGIETVKNKIRPKKELTKKEKLMQDIKVAGGKVASGAKYAGSKAAAGAKYAGGKAKEGLVIAGERISQSKAAAIVKKSNKQYRDEIAAARQEFEETGSEEAKADLARLIKEQKIRKALIAGGAVAAVGTGYGVYRGGKSVASKLRSKKAAAATEESYDYESDYDEYIETVESIDNLRLEVFDAYEAGLIDEDEKYTMLEMLDVENYE